MKKITLISALLAFLFTISSINFSVAQTFDIEVAAIAEGISLTGYTLVDYDVVPLKEGEPNPWDLTCYGEREYMIFAYAEKGVKDLALYIYDDKGNLITTDGYQDNSGITFTKFVANYATKAKIYAENKDSKRSRKSYKTAIFVAYKNLPKNSLSSTY